MFFYIDESGNTGSNLFDDNQPIFSYGLLSSRKNVDSLCEDIHQNILSVIKKDVIHANELGIGGLENIIDYLYETHDTMELSFDFYYINKLDFSLIHFFEAVFDQGLNQAVPYNVYWTPLKFLFIRHLSEVLTEDILKRSWKLYMAKNIQNHGNDITVLLQDIKQLSQQKVLDKRVKEIIDNALDFGIEYPLKLDFGNRDPKSVAPNAIGFQFICQAMARHLRGAGIKNAEVITIDRQSEFNKHQKDMLKFYINFSNSIQSDNSAMQRFCGNLYFSGLEKEDIIFQGIPVKNPSIQDSKSSIGLQLVDVYLWLTNKIIQGKPLSPNLDNFSKYVLQNAITDSISMDSMQRRWNIFAQENLLD